MKKYISTVVICLALTASALAQEAPPPHKSPRMPVNKEALADHKPAVPASREIQGQAIVIDSERLRVADFDIRLFGIVPPQLAASFGPQARAALDELTANQNITCLIRDRDHEGRFLATCHNAANVDLALELLRRGLAVVARGSVSSSDLAESYIAAEQAAETQKIGLWSVTLPAVAAVPEVAKPVTPAAATPAPPPAETSARPPVIEDKHVQAPPKPEPKQPKAAEIIPVQAISNTVGDISDIPSSPGFLARYQLLITGLVLLATALGMLGAIAVQRMLDRRTEMKAVAAALRGELMAARAVCLGRLKATVEMEDKDIAWPRIRSTLYQAYVGRLGWLGAELARWVASIYGQASDYAAYYDGSGDARTAAMPKRQALQTLVHHIDEVLPRLAIIEHTGSRANAEAGLVKSVASAETAVSQPAQIPESNPAATQIMPHVTRLWDKVRDLAQGSWASKKPVSADDSIAEYTALIEEEMKRFAFDESEEEPAPPANITKFQNTGT